MAATAELTTKSCTRLFSIALQSTSLRLKLPSQQKQTSSTNFRPPLLIASHSRVKSRPLVTCKATEVSPPSSSSSSEKEDGKYNWVPVVPLGALPKGERRVIVQDGETILLLWYKNDVYAIENRSPAEGAYSEGLINAKLTQDGCIVCPTTDSTFDLRTGEIKEWYPKNPVLRVLTPPLRTLFVYPVKTDDENIYISIRGSGQTDAATEIVFSGKAQPGFTATDVNVDEVRMVVDEDIEGFGFSRKNELINGKAAVIGFLLLLDFELLTGKAECTDMASTQAAKEENAEAFAKENKDSVSEKAAEAKDIMGHTAEKGDASSRMAELKEAATSAARRAMDYFTAGKTVELDQKAVQGGDISEVKYGETEPKAKEKMRELKLEEEGDYDASKQKAEADKQTAADRGYAAKRTIYCAMGNFTDAVKDKLTSPADIVQEARAAREYGGPKRGEKMGSEKTSGQ